MNANLPRNQPEAAQVDESPQVHVLIVDDKPANLDALEAILADTGFRIERAGSGSEALKALLKQQYACCLLDIRMPEMSGFETAQLIRQDTELRHMPIIFVTAEAADQREVFKGYEAGAVDFLIKPLEPAIVRSKVKVLGELHLQKLKLARSRAIEALNEQLRGANESLNLANRDLEHYTHIAAHDLREPLRKQRNLIHLLQREVPEDAGLLDLTADIDSTAEQLLGMVDDFRMLTKIGQTELQRAPVNLRDLVRSCLDEFSDRIVELAPVVTVHAGLSEELIYEPLVRILYVNLIRNVLDHVSEKHFELEFTVEEGADPSDPRVYGVRNSGSAIPPEQLGEIFKMFRKGTGGGSENSGVGLSICKRIIDRHKGRIYAESESNHVHVKFTFRSAQ